MIPLGRIQIAEAAAGAVLFTGGDDRGEDLAQAVAQHHGPNFFLSGCEACFVQLLRLDRDL